MSQKHPEQFFDQQHSATYDERFAKLAPLRDAIHLFCGAIFAELPADARLLCVGAGTGAELIYLAEKFPGWRFMAVEPSGPMLDICRRKVHESGIADRCEFHHGFLSTLDDQEPFAAATSILVSHFILAEDQRRAFFREIAIRLRPAAPLVTADLSSGADPAMAEELLTLWFRVLNQASMTAEQMEQMRAAYQKDVSLLSPTAISELIQAGGFERPLQFLQTGLIHGWIARRQA